MLDSIEDVSVDVHLVQSFSFQVWSFFGVLRGDVKFKDLERAKFT